MNPESRTIPVGTTRPKNGPTAPASGSQPQALEEVHSPLTDIHEGREGLILEADLPGATDEEVVVQLEDNVLTLQAQPKPPSLENARLIHEEYRVCSFFRSFILSDEVDRDRITADFTNGVLRLVLPRAERTKTRRIEIKTP